MFLVVGRGARYRRIDAIGAALAQPATQPGRVLTAADRIIVPHESSENGRKRFKRKVAQRNITSCNRCLHKRNKNDDVASTAVATKTSAKGEKPCSYRVKTCSLSCQDRTPTYLHPIHETTVRSVYWPPRW
jgi:hypothetical protein